MNTKEDSQLTVGQYLLDRLSTLGIKHIFGIPGDYIIRFNQLIERHPEIAFINTTRESAAGYAANAYAQVRGLGVACITYGVGLEIISATAQAYVESYPLVVIAGNLAEEEFKKHQERHHLINQTITDYGDLTQLEIFKKLTIAQGVLNSPSTAATIIEHILHTCQQNQKPVYLEIPRHIVDQPLSRKLTPSSFSVPSSNSQLLEETLKETETILSSSRFPLIWAGHEISRFKLNNELLAFAEKHHIPIISSLLGKTVVDEHHPLFVGIYQGEMSSEKVLEAVAKCDCLLMAGVILHDLDTGIFTIQIDQKRCIKANEGQVIINSHSYVLHLIDYIKGLKALQFPHLFSFPYTPRLAALPSPFEAKPETKITIKRTFECLQKYLTSQHIVVSDVGDCLFASADLVLPQNSFRGNSYFASIGTGIPEAIGAQFADLDRRVISLVGDGGFQISAMELSTAVRYQLDLIVIIFNNHGYGTERVILEGSFNDLVNWNYTNIPLVLGSGIGIKAETEEGLEEAFRTAFANRGTFYLIEVELDKNDFSRSLQSLGKSLR